MATNLSKSHFFDCGKNPPPQRVIRGRDGVRRIEKLPNGRIAQFVDGAGNTVWIQLVPPGMPPLEKEIDAIRAKLRRQKWFEVGLCPLATGALSLDDFPRELQMPCRDHRNNKGACPHVEHTIEKRRAEHADARAERHAMMNRREEEARYLAERQARTQEELNRNIERLVEHVAGAQGSPAPQAAVPASADTETAAPAPSSRGRRRGPDGE